MSSQDSFKIYYELGVMPGFRPFPIEFGDTELILYDRDKVKKIEIKYVDIDYVLKVPLFLVWQVEPLNWQIQIFLIRNILVDYSKEEIKDIRQWFPSIPLLTPESFGYGLKMFSPERNRLLEKFKMYGVKVTERFVVKEYKFEKLRK
ncbi:hypothetical protein A3D01_02915 [Candidatus Woesebacteria bacterium RIFCSPHIGHO2_02_FULL_39_13]|uniref:Uncharacterized protein n=1 Tax=Candidatus Woesebacteria bacterium RIFCSPHIGHO2_02_FULL_39_13 TaxID=1802505 RepID=A0A1F7YZA3_9BACT|nr:MAG: hypothetical protein A3D01_02915 [Candidatus Woesebacteria bacterium RIFCSPHIGHO2_02_FULL_39_13]OGM36891.1 MAG: hypothetical protein A3E13_01855 [Candidatus Woesebacteria bacterium RIFCSPHIGHO2_12_FULL_40_20]OGM72130.1 MAG: hypothetical protein A3H19_05565 [Candidatus Woesebacteria bacterium RIFCSPLOWO2_12_FULL_39_9]